MMHRPILKKKIEPYDYVLPPGSGVRALPPHSGWMTQVYTRDDLLIIDSTLTQGRAPAELTLLVNHPDDLL